MKTNFRKADYCPLGIIKPYQRLKLSRASHPVNRKCRAAFELWSASSLLGFDKLKQVRIDQIRVRGRHAVRQSRIRFQRAVLQ
jgi:hypothetical protein